MLNTIGLDIGSKASTNAFDDVKILFLLFSGCTNCTRRCGGVCIVILYDSFFNASFNLYNIDDEDVDVRPQYITDKRFLVDMGLCITFHLRFTTPFFTY